MGDAGSSFLGFIFGVQAIYSAQIQSPQASNGGSDQADIDALGADVARLRGTSPTVDPTDIDATAADIARLKGTVQSLQSLIADLTDNVPLFYSSGTWTPTLNSFTIVNGTGGITATGTYTRIGRILYYQVTIKGTGTATIASTGNTSTITGLAAIALAARGNSGVVQDATNSLTSTGAYLWDAAGTAATIQTPTWSAVTPLTDGQITVSGWYETL